MSEKGVIDRFEGSKAVLLIGTDQDRHVVEKSMLPAGAKEGDWLEVDIRDDHVFGAKIDASITTSATLRINEKLDQLRKR